MIGATVLGSSLGEVWAFAYKKKDHFHLLDLLARELAGPKGEGWDEEQLRNLLKTLKKKETRRLRL